MEDFIRRPVQALLNELTKGDLLHTDCMTVTGKTVGENIVSTPVLDYEVIRPLHDPHSPTGGLAILFGNLAPEGAVVKKGAVADEMMQHEGPARVFDSEEEAVAAILAKRILPGDVIVIRYEGPRGGQGCGKCLLPPRRLPGWALTRR